MHHQRRILMLKIEHLDEFRLAVAGKEEIREMDIGEGCTSFCYMVSAEGTFDTDAARECRGIVFNSIAGVVVGRPLHKFFNVGERAETQVGALDWSKVVRVMDKRDGSMIHTVWTMDGIRLKSKKSFTSDVAKAAEAWMKSEAGRSVRNLVHFVVSMNCTAIFEWTAPDARIVLFYPEAELKLLHIRNNETGEYTSGPLLQNVADQFRVNVVDEPKEFFDLVPTPPGVFTQGGPDFWPEFNIARMLDAVNTREGIEGWVIQFEDGNMVKVKTKWYLERHRAMTFLRERDIAEAVLNESLDDLKSLLVAEGVNIDELLDIEESVLKEIRKIAQAVNTCYEVNKDMTRKDFAMKLTGHPYFGLLMKRFTGQEPDVKGYFEKNMLKDMFTLRQLVLVPSVAEGD
jgi:RNA ligase